MTVHELLSRVSSTELAQWRAYEMVTGTLGPERDDLLTGILGSTVANVNRGKGSKSFSPEDFIPPWDGKPEQSWEDQLTIVQGLNQAFGGEIRKE